MFTLYINYYLFLLLAVHFLLSLMPFNWLITHSMGLQAMKVVRHCFPSCCKCLKCPEVAPTPPPSGPNQWTGTKDI